MKRIELLWFAGCPNHVAALEMVRDVVRETECEAQVKSVHVDDDQAALRLRFPGSPTIRVDGADIEPGYEPQDPFAVTCRVYSTPVGLRGLPAREWLVRALVNFT